MLYVGVICALNNLGYVYEQMTFSLVITCLSCEIIILALNISHSVASALTSPFIFPIAIIGIIMHIVTIPIYMATYYYPKQEAFRDF